MSEQPSWRWCRKCEGLFFSGHPSQGVCPADIGPHDSSESGPYVVDLGDSAIVGQNQWRWCSACEGLFFAGGGTLGRCPAGGRTLPVAAGTTSCIKSLPGPPRRAVGAGVATAKGCTSAGGLVGFALPVPSTVLRDRATTY